MVDILLPPVLFSIWKTETDKTVKGKLLSIKKGEYVELEGYLVTAYTTDSDSNIYWMSSDTRTDTGDGACEVIYVTDVKWLKQKK